MNTFFVAICSLLLLCLIGGLFRVCMGPGKTNRMLAAQLFGTILVSLTLTLAIAMENEALVDLALALSLLASVTIIAFLKLAGKPNDN